MSIQCKNCLIWYHSICSGFKGGDVKQDDFSCSDCLGKFINQSLNDTLRDIEEFITVEVAENEYGGQVSQNNIMMQSTINDLNEKIMKHEAVKNEQTDRIEQLKNDMKVRRREAEECTKLLEEYKGKLEDTEAEMTKKQKTWEITSSQVSKLRREKAAQEQKIRTLEDHKKTLRLTIDGLNEINASLTKENEAHEEFIRSTFEEEEIPNLTNIKEENAHLRNHIIMQEKELSSLREKNMPKPDEITENNEEIKNLEMVITMLEKNINTVQAEKKELNEKFNIIHNEYVREKTINNVLLEKEIYRKKIGNNFGNGSNSEVSNKPDYNEDYVNEYECRDEDSDKQQRPHLQHQNEIQQPQQQHQHIVSSPPFYKGGVKKI